MENKDNTKLQNEDKTKVQNQDDVNPSTQLDKLVEKENDQLPETTGTGSNRPLATEESVIIKKDENTDE